MNNRRKEYDWTNNRSVYNRYHKFYLEVDAKIHCSFCPYHKGENYTGNPYGGFGEKRLKYPSWKLATKNRKQWMKKGLKIKTYHRFSSKDYHRIFW